MTVYAFLTADGQIYSSLLDQDFKLQLLPKFSGHHFIAPPGCRRVVGSVPVVMRPRLWRKVRDNVRLFMALAFTADC